MENTYNKNLILDNLIGNFNNIDNGLAKYFSSYSTNSFSSYIENNKEYILLSTKALGLHKDQINIDIKNDYLTIKSNNTNPDASCLTSNINEKFKISNIIDKKNLTAKLDKGILEIKLPFKKSYSKSFKVDIS